MHPGVRSARRGGFAGMLQRSLVTASRARHRISGAGATASAFACLADASVVSFNCFHPVGALTPISLASWMVEQQKQLETRQKSSIYDDFPTSCRSGIAKQKGWKTGQRHRQQPDAQQLRPCASETCPAKQGVQHHPYKQSLGSSATSERSLNFHLPPPSTSPQRLFRTASPPSTFSSENMSPGICAWAQGGARRRRGRSRKRIPR
mmetsp:Transcript_13781/g.45960  ORF Transcript_13781/g.45960 Transcript_13781/m.45960 type:complete len:206 (-) Transcript_13781:17-634(-)